MREKEVRNKAEAHFEKYFNLHPEQKGYISYKSGKKSLKKIDLIIQHKEYTQASFGIEFKHFAKKRGYEVAKHCFQMQEYSLVEWNYPKNTIITGRIPIIALPQLSSVFFEVGKRKVINDKIYIEPRHPQNHDHHNTNSFLAEAFNFGEMRPIKSTVDESWLYRICFANKVLWREFDYQFDSLAINDYERFTGKIRDVERDSLNLKGYELILGNIDKYHQKHDVRWAK